jgi:ribosomal protein S1
MKPSLLKSALVAVAGLALCAPLAVQAQTDTTNPIATSPVKNPPATTSTKAAKNPSYKGTVKSIDASSLVVTTSTGDLTLAIAATTKVKNDDKKADITAITVGERVTGSYTKDDTGAMTAYSIHGHTGDAKKAKKAKKAAAAPATPATP